MGDGAVKIFLNANRIQDDVSKELIASFDYVSGKKPEDSFVAKLEEAVKEAKKNREWRNEYKIKQAEHTKCSALFAVFNNNFSLHI